VEGSTICPGGRNPQPSDKSSPASSPWTVTLSWLQDAYSRHFSVGDLDP